MTTAFYSYHEHFMHNTGSEHPEHALRMLAIEQELKKRGLWQQLLHKEGRAADMPDILRTHSPKYVEELHLIQPEQGHIYLDDDTPMGNGTIEAALRSEEHTSELQSRPHLVCRLLLEKKKKNKK